ncbi:hypothetical protein OXPF_30890 [Oxobacter pfennigii]|uniref:Uncharacterized protein n=1 Tax=Oxobacter pfennigii TaxID=36849 RepID=A0A0P8W778_9CLOT|nr:DUF6648 family protein [Oxobacter pfennigii]KPU43647.1 hypothetical protein OXPF_30890 [Oxobacter pfennigii]
MDYRLSENLYDRLAKKKNALIQKFSKGDLSKREFLIENFELIQNMNIKPFTRIDCFEKGYYNYQYYNTLAKYYRMEADYEKNNMKHPEIYKEYIDKSNFFYGKKDKTVLKVLELVDFKKVDAYYIKVNSTYLKNRLIEIVMRDYDNVIFHTRSPYIAERLISEGILYDEVRRSVIDSYINQTY